MKLFKFTIVSIFVLLYVNACTNDFLNIDPEQSVSEERAVEDINTLQTALNGVYSQLQDDYYYGRTALVIPDLMADNLYLSLRNTGRYLSHHNFQVREQDSYAEGLWNDAYEVVVNATRAIQGGEQLELSSGQLAQANQLIGEAYVLRALAHFDLLKFFGQPYNYTEDASQLGVPIITEVAREPQFPSRNTVAEGYDQVIKDLDQAINLLTEDTAEGVISLNAAKALLARVYLYKEDYEAAAQLATEVIESGEYSLLPAENYTDLWSEDYNSETIFEIVNTLSDNAGTNSIGHFLDPAGYADALATEDLYALYADEDVRKSVIVRGEKEGAESDALFVDKFPQGALHNDNIRILRLAELYLTRAEAYAKTSREQQALADLNTIIKQRNPEANDVEVTGPELIDRILLERRLELAFEGHRLFDLNRNKKDVAIDQGENVIQVSYPSDRFILPIPLMEINANPQIQPQNPGY